MQNPVSLFEQTLLTCPDVLTLLLKWIRVKEVGRLMTVSKLFYSNTRIKGVLDLFLEQNSVHIRIRQTFFNLEVAPSSFNIKTSISSPIKRILKRPCQSTFQPPHRVNLRRVGEDENIDKSAPIKTLLGKSLELEIFSVPMDSPPHFMRRRIQ
jgi:hypothetical protein